MYFRQFFQSIRQENSGAIAIVFAVTLPVLVIAAGMAVDYGRAVNTETAFQSAADSAVLAAASALANGKSKAFARERARVVFDKNVEMANFNVENVKPDIDIRTSGEAIHIAVDAHANVPTTLMKFAKINDMNVDVHSTSVIAMPRDEITFVIDTSWSMRQNGKLRALQAALRSFIEELHLFDKGNTYRVVSILPYSESLNFGSDFESWLGPDTRAAPHSDFVGCFRPQPDADILTDRKSSTGPGNLQAFRNTQSAGDPRCPPDGSQVLLFSADRSDVLASVANLDFGFGTATDIGMSWGWRSLSQAWSGAFPHTSSFPKANAEGTHKHLIVLTDGRPRRTDIDGDGDPSDKSGQLPLKNFQDICRNIKKQNDITVHSIGYGIETAERDIQDVLRNCVAKGGHYYDADSDDIGKILGSLLHEITRVRLTS